MSVDLQMRIKISSAFWAKLVLDSEKLLWHRSAWIWATIQLNINRESGSKALISYPKSDGFFNWNLLWVNLYWLKYSCSGKSERKGWVPKSLAYENRPMVGHREIRRGSYLPHYPNLPSAPTRYSRTVECKMIEHLAKAPNAPRTDDVAQETSVLSTAFILLWYKLN